MIPRHTPDQTLFVALVVLCFTLGALWLLEGYRRRRADAERLTWEHDARVTHHALDHARQEPAP